MRVASVTRRRRVRNVRLQLTCEYRQPLGVQVYAVIGVTWLLA